MACENVWGLTLLDTQNERCEEDSDQLTRKCVMLFSFLMS